MRKIAKVEGRMYNSSGGEIDKLCLLASTLLKSSILCTTCRE